MNLITLPSELFGSILQYVNGEDIINIIQTSSIMKLLIEEAMKIVHMTIHCDKIIGHLSVQWFNENRVNLILKEGFVSGYWKHIPRHRHILKVKAINGVPIYPWKFEIVDGIHLFSREKPLLWQVWQVDDL